MQKVFISYSWKDEAIALRLYRDLKRLSISIWLDRIDGEPTGDFKDEFLRLIANCDYFIVIDSENYRYNSHWCETELRKCFERIDMWEHGNNQQAKPVSMIVCRIDPIGAEKEWTKVDSIKDAGKRALFERLNRQLSYSLSHTGTYDNERTYDKSVEKISRILGQGSYSWDIFPEEMDLVDELNTSIQKASSVRAPSVEDDDRESLKYLLRSAILRRKQGRDVKAHFQLLITNCKELGLNLFVPRWAYSIWLADLKHGGRFDQECFDNLQSLANDFPDESRAWRGLGGIASRLNHQVLAAKCYQKALDLVGDGDGMVRYEILCNLGQTYMNQEFYFKAMNAYAKALEMTGKEELNSSIAVKYFECLMHLERNEEAGDFIINMVKEYPTVSEFQLSCGYYYLKQNQVPVALPYLRHAYSLNPSLEVTYALLRGLQRNGDKREMRRVFPKDLSKRVLTPDEEPWKQEILKLKKEIGLSLW